MKAHQPRLALAVLALLHLVLAAPVEAQAPRFLNILGYGAVGGAAGALATVGAECSGSGFICIPAEFVVATIGGSLVGMIAGNALASSANRAVDEDSRPGSGTLAALSLGSALGGAAVGVLFGGLLIDGEGSGTFLGSDEHTLLITGLAGATLGIVQIARRWGALTGHSVEVRPVLDPAGRTGLNLTVRF